jgi:hypothetical protein
MVRRKGHFSCIAWSDGAGLSQPPGRLLQPDLLSFATFELSPGRLGSDVPEKLLPTEQPPPVLWVGQGKTVVRESLVKGRRSNLDNFKAGRTFEHAVADFRRLKHEVPFVHHERIALVLIDDADPKAALAEIEQDAAEYRRIAERRVRLGLLLSEIGAANGVDITEQEMSRLIMQAASQYQGKDRENFIRYIQQEPMAAAQLRAPLYEDKVVDFLFAQAEIADRKATREALEADLESEEGHVHGPGCGHDHSHEPTAKKGSAKSKAKPKASAKEDSQLVRDEPAKGPVEKASSKPKPAKPLKDAPGAKAPQAKAAAKPAAKKASPKKPAK